ncbi:hypothetical protein K437DRAFT_295394 [Tilletiaria anomala UBC 951]|uniref:Uncharacterized protein n=1 Tax=Tilletiaria anomala (strain ATCC 24038 / CBS 436.72 / UBC 951) TaxID=1037660 RepID=A0A066VUT5_TILAU|nr:uncharacterized protein K437DRAFT_295394 [Tilletiaria anomala UBC 951]KDN42300.1 hypothetical protein K437DRAFT_295394 [Tilletiaria anomala UBC 951]
MSGQRSTRSGNAEETAVSAGAQGAVRSLDGLSPSPSAKTNGNRGSGTAGNLPGVEEQGATANVDDRAGRARPPLARAAMLKRQARAAQKGISFFDEEEERLLKEATQQAREAHESNNGLPLLQFSTLTKDKGKARAIDAPSQAHALSLLSKKGGDERLNAPLQNIPTRNIFSIEYPGFILPPAERHKPGPSGLERALATLSPDPPPLSNPQSALEHMANLLDRRAEVVECRLGAKYYPPVPKADDTARNGAHGANKYKGKGHARDSEARHDHVSQHAVTEIGKKLPLAALNTPSEFQLDSSLYKHPILGNVVATNNPIIRIRRRKWKRRGATGIDGQDAGVCKEYMIELVGTAKQTVRFRTLAEYAFEPEVGHVHLGDSEVLKANAPIGLPLRQGTDWSDENAIAAGRRQHRDDESCDSEMDIGEQFEMHEELSAARTSRPRSKGKRRDSATLNAEQYAASMLDNAHGTVLRRKATQWPSTGNKTLSLHAAMMTMNTQALRAFRFDPELQDYLVEVMVPHKDKKRHVADLRNVPCATAQDARSHAAAGPAMLPFMKSNLNLIPPARFLKQNPPFPYYFRQNAYASILETPQGDGTVRRRWVNERSWKGYSAIAFQFARPARGNNCEEASDGEEGRGEGDDEYQVSEGDADEGGEDEMGRQSRPVGKQDLVLNTAPTPLSPPPHVEAQRKNVQQDLLKRLERMFEEQPIWSRARLTNQFESKQDRQALTSSKLLIPLVAYQIVDGPYKGSLVRFGYDVRADPNSRFFQRLSFRTLNQRRRYRRSRKITKHYGTEEAEDATPLLEDDEDEGVEGRDGDMREEEDQAVDGGGDGDYDRYRTMDADGEAGSRPGSSGTSNKSHIFDGKKIHDNMASFFLVDITDPSVQELVNDTSPRALRQGIDVHTGWYTMLQWELLREVTSLKYRCVSIEGREAAEDEVKFCIKQTKDRLRRAGALSVGVGEDWDVDEYKWDSTRPGAFEERLAEAQEMMADEMQGAGTTAIAGRGRGKGSAKPGRKPKMKQKQTRPKGNVL